MLQQPAEPIDNDLVRTVVQHIMLGTADAIPWDTFTDPTTTFTADGQWTNCSDTSQPGIAPIVSYLATLPWHPASNCASGRYNMINNLSPGILPNAAHR